MGHIKLVCEAILKSLKSHILRNLFLFVIIAVWFIFSSYWVGVINNCILSPINKYVQAIAAISSYWVFFILLVVYYCIVLFGKERVAHPLRFRIASGVAVAYFISIVFGYWSFTNWFCHIGYSDIFFLPFLFEFFFLCKVVRFSMIKEEEKYEGLEFDKPILVKEPDQVDISLHSLLIWGIKKIRHFTQKKNELQPTIDQNQVDDKDTYGRKNYANSVAAQIIKTYDVDLAFATGITGAWGNGKSSFLNLIKQGVRSQNSEIVIIDFKPWFCKSPEFIIDEFFTQFERAISVYSPSISRLLNQYALSLSDIKGTDIGAWINFAAHCFANQDIQTQYENISKKLREAKIKTMVFIDDIDRLDKSEIMEVLRLIRNTANFPYLQFIVAYDKEYVTSTIHDLMPGKESEYLEKIFNVEITLPKYEDYVLWEELKRRIEKICTSNNINIDWTSSILDYNFNEYLSSINKIKPNSHLNIIQDLFNSNRDVIRFCNSFMLSISALCGIFKDRIDDEISIRDFFCLELVRYKYPNVYDMLRDNHLVLLKKTYEGNAFYKLNDIDIDHKCKALLEILFTKESHHIRGITLVNCYMKYFTYRNETGSILLADIDAWLSCEENGRKPILNDWLSRKVKEEFIASKMFDYLRIIQFNSNNRSKNEILAYKFIIDLLNDLKEEKYSKFIDCFVNGWLYRYLSTVVIKEQASDAIEKLSNLLFLYFKLSKRIDCSIEFLDNRRLKELYKGKNQSLFESALLKENSVKIIPIAYSLLNDIQFNNSVIIETHLITIFKTYLVSDEVVYYEDYAWFDKKENISFNRVIGEKMLQCVINNPNRYFSKFIREAIPYLLTDSVLLFPDPFLYFIFEDKEEVGSFIKNGEYDKIDGIDKVRNFWSVYESNDFKNLIYNNEDYNQIKDTNLEKIVKERDKLNEIYRDLRTVEKKLSADKSLNIGQLKEKYSKLMSDFGNTCLYEYLDDKIEETKTEIERKYKLLEVIMTLSK